MNRAILFVACLLSVSGCASNQFADTTLKDAKRNIEKREQALPDDLKTGNGNIDDIKKGAKHATNEGIFKLFLSLFGSV
ncbi:hypothetical protein SAMN05216262_1227 [Colwellia chukchiensis]|uniref:Lipoprotein n=1 Tax=Colwellia chukchiensis TaxID=641665 RepID=A0A1H7T010_9GAMM|nr:hypothetical protein [Colwellia chukchiensis]SEL78173.1 hypothetical protein SAMN05216262_1227 [Colwellia chukchiensis]